MKTDTFTLLGLNKREWIIQVIFITIILTSFALLNLDSALDWVALYIPLAILRDSFLHKEQNNKKYYLQILKQTVLVIILYYLIQWLGKYGLLGYLILILSIATIKIYLSRKLYLRGLRTIENQIWGSSADERRKRKRFTRSNGKSK